ncbi:MAG: hypothetical protein JWM72_2133 [Actinomycetia bacterium]|jgi:hypothetical protein|nr:hypothetical protein [Actinomycetes bacterium]MDQ1462660.1 hypothetical protein [Actinomycetota bacterium]
MLELRLNADAKRIAAMRASVAHECRRANVDDEHAALVGTVVERLIVGERADSGKRSHRSEVFVVVTVQSDATMLMVRDRGLPDSDLDEYRRRLLDVHTVCWSTVSGADGRTIWAEIPRPTPVASEPMPAAEPAPPAAASPALVAAPALVSVLPSGK